MGIQTQLLINQSILLTSRISKNFSQQSSVQLETTKDTNTNMMYNFLK